MNIEEKAISRFQENVKRRLIRKLLFINEEKVRSMYGRRDEITKYIEAMPLIQELDNELAAKGELLDLKMHHMTYWSCALDLEADGQNRLSEIWDAGILGKFENPDVGRAVIYFHDGRKMTEEAFLTVMIQTFRL